MKFDLSSFILGGFTMGLIHIGIDVLSYFIDKHLDKKHTGGSFLESYKDNKNGDDDNGGIS